MIWPVCFISVAHLFQIHLYTSDLETVSDLIFPFDVSWTDVHNQHELMIQSSTNSFRIQSCSNSIPSLLIARCMLIDRKDKSSYRCYSSDPDHQITERRFKRAVNTTRESTNGRFRLIIIGIPCLVGVIVVGLIFLAFYLRKRRSETQQTDAKLRSFDIINTSTTNPMQQPQIKSTVQAVSPIPSPSLPPKTTVNPTTTPMQALPNRFTSGVKTVQPRMISNPSPTVTPRSAMKTPYKASTFARNNHNRIQRRSSLVRSHSR